MFILAILLLFIGGGLALFAWRAPTLKQGGLFAPISREGALVFNNLFLTTCCLTVLTGTLYPLALEALTGTKISVGAPFFNLTFGPLFVALMFAMPFGPLLAWKRGDLLGVAQRLMAVFAVGLVAVAAAFALEGGQSVLAPFGVGLASYVMAGAVLDLVERTGLFRSPLATVRKRAAGLPRSAWGTAVAHFGIAVSMLGIICAGTWGTERIVALKPSQTVSLSGYDLSFDGLINRPRSELHCAGGQVYGPQRRRGDRHDGAVQAQLCLAPDDDERSGADDARAKPALSVARRYQRRRLDRDPALLQADGDADLVRRRGDDVGRRSVAV